MHSVIGCLILVLLLIEGVRRRRVLLQPARIRRREKRR